MESFIFGRSSQGLPIMAYRFGSSGPHILILGGVHGDESEGVKASLGLLEKFQESYFPYNLKVTLVPAFNIDGVLANTRTNARGVDLNRNLPTKDWSPEAATPRYNPGPSPCSEPENQALAEFIATEKPRLVLSLHSWKPVINVNGSCRPEAEVLKKLTGYEIVEDIGYPTPGSLGTFTGLERDIPTITYEIERGLGTEPILQKHVPALIESLKTSQARF